jgi:hypothetical protein
MSKRHKYPMYWNGTKVPDHVNFIFKRDGFKAVGVSRRSGKSQISLRNKSGKWPKYLTRDSVQGFLGGITAEEGYLLWSRSDYEPPISSEKLSLFLRTFLKDSAWLAEGYDWYEDRDKYLVVKVNPDNQSHTLFDFNSKDYQPLLGGDWTRVEICHVSEVQGLLDYLGIILEDYLPDEEPDEEDQEEEFGY